MSDLNKSRDKNKQVNNNSKTIKETDKPSSSKRPRLSSCFGNLIKPSPQQSETDDEFDEDGGLKPKSISTIKELISKQPRLSNTSSSSKTSTKNQINEDDDEDDDGGINLNSVIKRRQQEEEKRKMKNEAKKKKKSIVKLNSQEDEDKGILKQTNNVNRKQSKTKFQCIPDVDEDDDGVPKRKQSIKKKKSNKENSFEEDKDGGCIITTADVKRRSNSNKQSKTSVIKNKNNEIQNKEKSDSQSSDDSTKRNLLRRPSYEAAQLSKTSSSLQTKIEKLVNNNLCAKVKSVRSPKKTTNDERQAEIDLQIRRRKLARNRWFLAYTLIHNYHLFDLRKRLEERLLFVRSKRINQNNSQLNSPVVTNDKVHSKSSEIRKTIPSISVDESSSTIAHALSGPKTIDYPQSPAERYVTSLSQMFYSVNTQSPDGNRSPSPFVFPNENLPSPSITSSTIFGRQMSHQEHMERWYQNEMKKRQSKQRFAYAYAVRPQRFRSDQFTTLTILIPKII